MNPAFVKVRLSNLRISTNCDNGEHAYALPVIGT